MQSKVILTRCLILTATASMLVPVSARSQSKTSHRIAAKDSAWIEQNGHIPYHLVYTGSRILGTIGYNAYIWDARTGRVLQEFVGHSEYVGDVRFSPDGKLVLTSTGIMMYSDMLDKHPEDWPKDISTRLWDAETGKQVWTLPGQFAAAFSPDGKRVIAFSLLHPYGEESNLSVWDVASGLKLVDARPVACKDCLPISATSAQVTFSPDSRSFMSLETGGRTTLWDADSGQEIGFIKSDVDSFHYHGKDGEIATSSEDAVELWSATLRRIQRVELEEGLPTAFAGYKVPFAWTSDGRWFVGTRWHSRGGKDYVQICDLDSSRTLTFVSAVDDGKILVNPDGRRFLLYGGGYDEENHLHPMKLFMYTLRGRKLWDIETKDLDVASFSPDGRTFLAQDESNGVTIYRSDTGKVVRTVELAERK